MPNPEFLEFATRRRIAAQAAIDFHTDERLACEAMIARLAAEPVPEDPAPTEPKPEEPRPEEPKPEEPKPEEPKPEEPRPEEPKPEEPTPADPAPTPTPPITGGHNAFGPAELLAKLAAAKGGEVISAKSGYAYEGLTVSGVKPTSKVIVAAEPGARFGQVVVRNSSKLALMNLPFLLASAPVPTKATPHFVTALNDTSEIEVIDCDFRSRTDADAYPDWALADWVTWKMGAVLLSGPDSVIDGCTATAVNMGFSVGGVRSAIRKSTVFGFSRDGARLTADYCTFDDNHVQDAINIGDKNHWDGLQLFEVGNGHLVGLRIRRNTILADAGIKGNPLLAPLQGIGGYGSPDGSGDTVQTTCEDLIAEDNVVEATNWHGMAFCITNDASVLRNRVTGYPMARPTAKSWLKVYGRCANVVVTDNQASDLKIAAACAQARNALI